MLGTSKQAVSKLVEAMVAAGYVERDADPDDARAKRVQLSDRGRQLLAAVEEVYAELERNWAAALGEERLQALRADLVSVLSATSGGRLPAVRAVG
jgi:DNA-binding MarR family transcriptional regulator